MRFYLCMLALITASITPCAAQEQPRGQITSDFDTVKVANGVYAFIAPEPKAGIVQGNSTAIIGNDGVLVVDTGQFPSLAERHIAEIRKLTDKPVRYVLLTHWHGDHNWGASAYLTAFPDVVVLSHDFTRQVISKSGPKFLAQATTELPQLIELIKKRLAEGKRRDGTPLTEEQKLGLKEDLAAIQAAAPEFPKVKNPSPNLTFDGNLTLHLGNREVQVKWLGRGNTAGDAIVWVPDTKTLLTGDTVVYPTPYGIGSYFSEWPTVLQKMIDMKAAAIVPGHGPVMHDYAYFERLKALFAALTSQVKQAVAKGMSLEDTRKVVTLADFSERFAGSDPFRKRAFQDFFVSPGVTRAYEEATGKMSEEGI